MIAGVVLVNFKGKFYLVSNSALEKLRGRVFRADLFLAINEKGDSFVYLVRADSPSACAVVEEAKANWIRVRWHKGKKVHTAERSARQLPEPVWLTDSFEEVVEAAFDDRIIDGPVHPLISEIVAGGKAPDAVTAESGEDEPSTAEIGAPAPGAAGPVGAAKPR